MEINGQFMVIRGDIPASSIKRPRVSTRGFCVPAPLREDSYPQDLCLFVLISKTLRPVIEFFDLGGEQTAELIDRYLHADDAL